MPAPSIQKDLSTVCDLGPIEQRLKTRWNLVRRSCLFVNRTSAFITDLNKKMVVYVERNNKYVILNNGFAHDPPERINIRDLDFIELDDKIMAYFQRREEEARDAYLWACAKCNAWKEILPDILRSPD